METIFGTGHIKKKGKNLPEVVGAVDEVKIESRRREKLKAFDRHLKAFKYSAALDSGIGKVSLVLSSFSSAFSLLFLRWVVVRRTQYAPRIGRNIR